MTFLAKCVFYHNFHKTYVVLLFCCCCCCCCCRFSTSYKKYDVEFRCEVAKYAVVNGNRPAAAKFKVAESAVRGFIKTLKRQQAEEPGSDVTTLPPKKGGRSKLLPEEIDEKVISTIKSMRESGSVINYNIIIAIANGVIQANDCTLLKEYGGNIELRYQWCLSITRRLGFVKRKVTTSKLLLAPGLKIEVGLTFYHTINEIVKAHSIPPEMVVNTDQTPLPFVLFSKYTLDKKGTSRVPIPDTFLNIWG